MMESPKWKKIKGEEHSLTNRSIEFDLTGLEDFVNEMLGQGWRLIRVQAGTYFTFVPCAPGEYICRTAITVTKRGFFDKEAAASIGEKLGADGAMLVEQTGTLGSKFGIIALRPAVLGAFEIASDLDSRIAEYEARKKYSESSGVSFLVIGLAYIPLSFAIDNYAFLALFFAFLVIALNLLRPVDKYKKIIAELKAERDASAV